MSLKILKPQYYEEYKKVCPDPNRTYPDVSTPDEWWEVLSDGCPSCDAKDARIAELEEAVRWTHNAVADIPPGYVVPGWFVNRFQTELLRRAKMEG